MTRIVIDPVTRIEGHLRMEVELDDQEKVKAAYSSGTMIRGIERILVGRDPRDAWAFTQRFCGVCTTVHAFASIRAVEDALGIQIPKNANLIRNLMIAQQYVHDHVMHFYHLHALDWVDLVSALSAEPAQTSEIARSISAWPNSSPGYFADVQNRLKAFVESGQLGIFANAYWGHPAYKLPAEINLLGAAHYLAALDWQKDVVALHAVFGGKNPHPNFIVGGVPCPIGLDSDNALNAERLSLVGDLIGKMTAFVDQVYLPDLLAIAPYYKDWAGYGEGLGNFLVWGEFPQTSGAKFVPAGAILNRDLTNVIEPDPRDFAQVQEFVAHSWYDYSAGDSVGLHPFQGETDLHYTGPRPPYEQLDVEQKYSWLKAPRWNGKAMEVGPLARVLVMYAKGNAQVKELVDGTLAKLNAPLTAVFSTLGRTAARCIETVVFAHKMQEWYQELVANIKAGDEVTWDGRKWEPRTWPVEARGFGFMEAPRGALGHWIVIRAGKIANYQAVVPSTWNAGPRDANGEPGAYEASLVGTPLADPQQPLEILRTIHSFDPCLACAVHVLDLEGKELGKAEVHAGSLVPYALSSRRQT
jgi:hydrogenase large subunit